jgi:glycosyltransferase involved in cell wall biosynthesis
MRASIVIASHNEADLLRKTVHSCAETIGDLDCEIVVYDDASEDDCVERLRRDPGGAKISVGTSRSGASRSKDAAAQRSSGDVLVFLDAHCKPEPGAIEGLVQGVESWNGEAIIAPRVVSLDPERWENQPGYRCVGCWLDLEWLRCGTLETRDMTARLDRRGRRFYEEPSMIGCSFAMTRGLYERLRRHDTDMQSWGCEDLDLGLKCWLMGYSILIDPDAIIGHRFRERNDTYAVPDEHYLSNEIRMARKNFQEPAWEDWFERFRECLSEDRFDAAWSCFEQDRESAEVERDYLLSRRPRDEYQYAATFGLAWPLTLPSSPLPAPARSLRPRFSKTHRQYLTIHSTSHEAPVLDPEEEEPTSPAEPREDETAPPDEIAPAESTSSAVLSPLVLS